MVNTVNTVFSLVRYASTHMSLIDRPPETNSLMECGRCMRLVHPSCETDYGVEGVIRSVIICHMGAEPPDKFK